MGEQVRSASAEKAYNARWLAGMLGGLLIVSVLAAMWMMAVAHRLPAELAIHWNGRNEVDNWAPVGNIAAGTVALTVGAGGITAVIAVLSRGQNILLARMGAGFGVGFGVGLAAMMAAIVAGQIDLADTSGVVLSGPALSGPVMAAGLVLALALGALVMWLYRPGEVQRTPSVEVAAMNEAARSPGSPLALAGQGRAARGETMAVKLSMGSRGWLLSLGVGSVVALSVFFIFPLLALLGVAVGALTRVLRSGTAVIGPDGVKVMAGGFWKVMPLGYREIRAAAVEDVSALDHGGWGFRINGGSSGFIMASGPALAMEAGFHQKFVVSMPDAATAGGAAALVNAYVNAYVNAGKVQN